MENKIVTLKNLECYHNELSKIIDNKQDEISDLDDIRSGASLGYTALQAVPEEYITEDELNNSGFLTQSDKTELNEYDQFLLSKINNIDLSNYLTIDENKKNELVVSTALNELSIKIDNLDLSDYLTIEESRKKNLVIATALNDLSDRIDKNKLAESTAVNDLLAKITTLESNLSTAMTKISELE